MATNIQKVRLPKSVPGRARRDDKLDPADAHW
jgi:hypothetical protein